MPSHEINLLKAAIPRDAEYSHHKVQLHFKLPQVVKGLCQVKDESFIFPSLDDQVINV
jgi:hypothetical protein